MQSLVLVLHGQENGGECLKVDREVWSEQRKALA